MDARLKPCGAGRWGWERLCTPCAAWSCPDGGRGVRRRGRQGVSGKGHRHERLPLPADVGEAVVAYLSEFRPAAAIDPGGIRRHAGPAPGADPGRGHPGGGPPAPGPGWARSARTGCGTPRPPACCAPGHRWPRSGRCCGTAAPLTTQTTPRSTATGCARWPGPGRVRSTLSGLRPAVAGYLAIRRAMGFTMERHAKLLGQFTEHLVAHHAATLDRSSMLWPGRAPRAERIRAGGRRGCRWSVASPSICTAWVAVAVEGRAT